MYLMIPLYETYKKANLQRQEAFFAWIRMEAGLTVDGQKQIFLKVMEMLYSDGGGGGDITVCIQ